MPCSPLGAGSVRGRWRAARRPKYRWMTQAPQAARCYWVLRPCNHPCSQEVRSNFCGERSPPRRRAHDAHAGSDRLQGLQPLSGAWLRRPHRPIVPAGALRQSLPTQVETLIVALKRDKPRWGARKIRELLLRRLPRQVRRWGHRSTTTVRIGTRNCGDSKDVAR